MKLELQNLFAWCRAAGSVIERTGAKDCYANLGVVAAAGSRTSGNAAS